MTQSESIIRELWEPISELTGPEWVSENVELPPDSELKQFDFELFPLARFALTNLCHNDSMKRFTEMLSSQVGKTVTILAYVCWKIINKPSGVGWFTDTGINAKGDYKTKILPMLESCGKVKTLLPSDRAKKGNTLVQFGFMNLRVMGAESKANREGKTITEVLCDEVRNYPPGAMEQIDNRFKTVTSYRRILFSSPGESFQEPNISFQNGTRHLGFWKCPHCQHKQTFRFGREPSPLYPVKRNSGGFIWEVNATTKPGENIYNFAELIKTIRYQCENESCKYEFHEHEKLALIRETQFEQTNMMADPNDISVHCWEAYMPFSGCSWSSIVIKFLKAVVAKNCGNIEPMKVFIKETIGEPWEEHGEKVIEGEIMQRCGDYVYGEEWPSEIKCARQIVADVQHGYLHFNYSAFNLAGEKRTIERGRLLGFDELREYQLKKKVQDAAVGIDCAHRPSDVYAATSLYGKWIRLPENAVVKNPARVISTQTGKAFWDGWVALYGSDNDEFQIGNVKTFFKGQAIDSNIGKAGHSRQVLRVTWSNPHYKNELFIRRIKGQSLGWFIPSDISLVENGEYLTQMQAVERHELFDAEGKLNGYEWKETGRHDDADCEQFQLVLADVNGLNK